MRESSNPLINNFSDHILSNAGLSTGKDSSRKDTSGSVPSITPKKCPFTKLLIYIGTWTCETMIGENNSVGLVPKAHDSRIWGLIYWVNGQLCAWKIFERRELYIQVLKYAFHRSNYSSTLFTIRTIRPMKWTLKRFVC